MQLMNFREQLKSHRERAGLSKQELADILQISSGYLGNVENGSNNKIPTKAMSERIADALNLTPAEKLVFVDAVMSERLKGEVSEWLSQKIEIKNVPLISWVSINKVNTPVESFISEQQFQESVSYTGKWDDCVALRVKDDSMVPEFLQDEIIIVSQKIEPRNNDFVIIADNKSNEAMFRQFKRYGRKIILHPLNPKYSDIEAEHSPRDLVVGVVVEKLKRYK